MDRLELLDVPAARSALHAAVEAARHDRRPVLDGDTGLEVDLRPIRGVSVAARRQDPGVNLGAEAETPPSVASIEPDAPEPLLLGDLADRDLEIFRRVVEFHYRSIIIFRCWVTDSAASPPSSCSCFSFRPAPMPRPLE